MSITKTEPVSEETYWRLALGNSQLELHRGQLREKPGMSVAHDNVIDHLQRQLYRQLREHEYRLRSNNARLRIASDTYYVPDIAVIPTGIIQALFAQPNTLDAYSDPLPLVIEVWAPSTGTYDINEKLASYQQRGDLEIWYVHPYERTLKAWRRRRDGTYDMTVSSGGMVQPQSLPGVAVDLDALFQP